MKRPRKVQSGGYLGHSGLGVIMSVCLSLALPGFPSQDQLRHETTVTAVEVPVRVLRTGKAVKGLTKDDFEVYENGVKQQLSGFEIISRKISGKATEAKLAAADARPQPRLFILIFDVFDYNDAIGEAIDYFFLAVFRPSDQLLVMTENRFLIVEMGKNPDDLAGEIKEILKETKKISLNSLHRAYMELEEECQRLLNSIGDDSLFKPLDRLDWDQSISRFYVNYSRIWTDYRDRFLVPDMAVFQVLLKRVKPIQGDKWAICFRQRELLPKLKSQGRLERSINRVLDSMIDPAEQAKAQLIRYHQRQLYESFAISKGFPVERLKNLFLEAGITFHLILMKVSRSVQSQDLDLREVAEDYEAFLKNISRSTGGSVTFSNKASAALKNATETEDYHYLLAYQSRAPLSKRGKDIEVKVRVSGVRVFSLKQVQKLGERAITIAGVQTEGTTIRFDLKNCTIMATDKGPQGIVEVRVTLFNGDSEKVFSETKVLEAEKEQIAVVLRPNQLLSGSYLLIIEAQDRITNERDVQSRVIKF